MVLSFNFETVDSADVDACSLELAKLVASKKTCFATKALFLCEAPPSKRTSLGCKVRDEIEAFLVRWTSDKGYEMDLESAMDIRAKVPIPKPDSIVVDIRSAGTGIQTYQAMVDKLKTIDKNASNEFKARNKNDLALIAKVCEQFRSNLEIGLIAQYGLDCRLERVSELFTSFVLDASREDVYGELHAALELCKGRPLLPDGLSLQTLFTEDAIEKIKALASSIKCVFCNVCQALPWARQLFRVDDSLKINMDEPEAQALLNTFQNTSDLAQSMQHFPSLDSFRGAVLERIAAVMCKHSAPYTKAMAPVITHIVAETPDAGLSEKWETLTCLDDALFEGDKLAHATTKFRSFARVAKNINISTLKFEEEEGEKEIEETKPCTMLVVCWCVTMHRALKGAAANKKGF